MGTTSGTNVVEFDRFEMALLKWPTEIQQSLLKSPTDFKNVTMHTLKHTLQREHSRRRTFR